MRTTRLALLTMVFGMAMPAGAAPIAFTGTLRIDFGPVLGTITAQGSGVAESGGPGGSFSLPAGVFSLSHLTAITPPILVIDGFGVGATGQTALPLAPGTNKALTFHTTLGYAEMGLVASAYALTGGTNVAGGVSLGRLGLNWPQVGASQCPVFQQCLVGQPYVFGAVTVMRTLFGSPATVMATGFDNRTAEGGGLVQMVSPSSFNLGPLGATPAVATLTIHLVPEPGTALLLAGGLGAIGALARRTRKLSRALWSR